MAPAVASAIFSAVFIARAGLVADGHPLFTLWDDAMISMRYARNLALGHGLAWNTTGKPVEGFSDPLWTLWMALLHLVPGPLGAPLLVQASGAVLLAVGVLSAARLARQVAPGVKCAGPLAAWLTAFYFPLAFWTLRGFETGLMATLVTLSVTGVLVLLDNPRGGWLVTTAAAMVGLCLTRADGFVPVSCMLVFLARATPPGKRARVLGPPAAAVAVAVLGQEALRLAIFGDLLPNTYYLKVVGVPLGTRLHRGLVALAYTTALELYAPLALGAALVVGAWRGGVEGRARRAVLLLALVIAGQWAYTLYVGGDAWEGAGFADRFLVVVGPLEMTLLALALAGAVIVPRWGWLVLAGAALAAALAAVLGFAPAGIQLPPATDGQALPRAAVAVVVLGAALRSAWRPRLSPVRPFLAGVACILALAAVDGGAATNWVRFNARAIGLDRALTLEGMALARDTAPGVTIAYGPAGSAAYYSDRPAVDLLGHSDPVVARAPNRLQFPAFRPGHSKWDYAYSINGLRPSLVMQPLYIDADEEARMKAWGYRYLGVGAWVRGDATGTDVARLTEDLGDIARATGADPGPP